jgi:hypothetical protein
MSKRKRIAAALFTVIFGITGSVAAGSVLSPASADTGWGG